MQEKTVKNSPLIETLICAVLFFAAAWLGRYTLATYLFLPFLGSYTYARNGISWALLLLVTGAVIFWFLMPAHFWAAAVIVAVPSLITGAAVRRKTSSYEACAISAAGWLLAAGGIVGYVWMTTGMDPLSAIMDGLRTAIPENETLAALLYGIVRQDEITQAFLSGLFTGDFGVYRDALMLTHEQISAYLLDENVLAQVNNFVGVFVPLRAMRYVVLGGLGTYLTSRAFAKKAGREVSYMPPFRMLRLPPKVSAYFLFTYILALLPQLFNIESLILPGIMLESAVGVVFAVQGITLIAWLFSRKLNNKLSVFLSLLIGIPLSGIMVYIGFVDQMLKIRDRVRPKGPQSGQ